MIHIATTHYGDDRWIEVQLTNLARYTDEPYRVYAALERIDAGHHPSFDHVADHDAAGAARGLKPGQKLTLLAEVIVRQARSDDLLVFMHGDAFPIAQWVGPIRGMLAETPLAAVRRDENFEPTPHECFCVTTPQFWAEIGGRWERGPTWESNGQRATDTSATLWQTLERRGIAWYPILRTNRVNLHPLWFGIYGDLVYHHGAGFRSPMSRLDAAGYSDLPVPLRNLAGARRRIANSRQSRRMYRRIVDDEHFYRGLMQDVPA